MKKKKSKCRKSGWATAHFFALGHDTGNHAQGRAWLGRTRPRHGRACLLYGQQTTTIWPARGACSSVRAHGLAPKSRYNGLYHGLGRPFCHNRGSDTGCDTTPSALLHGAGALRHTWQCARHGARQGLGSRYNFCIVIGRGDDMAACARVCVATRPQHGRAWPATRLFTRHDTTPSARCACGLGAVHTQAGSGCAHCTPDTVLTQCTVLSHYLGHC